MRKVVDDIRLMTKVCDLYYNESISQQEIAKKLSISRPTVSRLLSSAREIGVVKIQVADLEDIKHWDLENRIQEQYHLKEVIIVDSQETKDQTQEMLGRAAARYLAYHMKDGITLGVSMGSTVYHMTSNIQHMDVKNVRVVPMIGGQGQLRTELHANSIAENLARAFGGSITLIHAPARVSNVGLRDEKLKVDSLKDAFQYSSKIDLAVLGIGYPNAGSSIKATGYFNDQEIEELKRKHVAGEINMQFYDINGEPYKDNDTVIGIALDKIRKIPISIGVAGGRDKADAVIGAIAGGYVNILITDMECAKVLDKSRSLEQDDQG